MGDLDLGPADYLLCLSFSVSNRTAEGSNDKIIRSFQDFELTLPWVGSLETWRSLVRATWEAQRPSSRAGLGTVDIIGPDCFWAPVVHQGW